MHRGNPVRYRIDGAVVDGLVVQRHSGTIILDGREVAGSEDLPAFVLRSTATGAVSVRSVDEIDFLLPDP